MKRSLSIGLALLLGLAWPLAAGAAEKGSAPTVVVDAEGKVTARPDQATLVLEVETQAAGAEAAGQENARVADGLLKAVKKALAPEDKIQSLGYRLAPIYSREKARPGEITGYQAINRFQGQIKGLERLGPVIDTALKNGASRVQGPYFGHSRQEELQREATVDAIGRARRLAEAMAQAAGLKIKGVQRLSTTLRPILPRAAPEGMFAAAKAEAPTPIEVGEEEIRATVQATFELAP